MKLKDFVNKIKPLMKDRDFFSIYADDPTIDYRVIIHDIENKFKKYPLLKEAEIIKTNTFNSQYSDGIKGTIKGTCKEYSAQINYDDYYKAVYSKK